MPEYTIIVSSSCFCFRHLVDRYLLRQTYAIKFLLLLLQNETGPSINSAICKQVAYNAIMRFLFFCIHLKSGNSLKWVVIISHCAINVATYSIVNKLWWLVFHLNTLLRSLFHFFLILSFVFSAPCVGWSDVALHLLCIVR